MSVQNPNQTKAIDFLFTLDYFIANSMRIILVHIESGLIDFMISKV